MKHKKKTKLESHYYGSNVMRNKNYSSNSSGLPYMHRRTQDFNVGEVNVHTTHKIYNLHWKCSISFNLGVANLYNFKILVANTTIKLGAVAPAAPLGPSLHISL